MSTLRLAAVIVLAVSAPLALDVTEAINRHCDAMAVETASAVRDAQSEIDPFVARFRGRAGRN